MTTFIAKIKHGLEVLDFGSPYNRARYYDWCKQNIGKEVRIKEIENNRTLSQNALYWKFLELIERETGNSANNLHEYFKRVHLPPKFIKVLGKEIKIPKSTTELTKIEFIDYLDKISAESNVEIPNTKEWNDYKNSAPTI